MFVELAGGILGTLAGNKAAEMMGAGGSSGPSATDMVNNMNAILNRALNSAIQTSTNYTNQAITQQQSSGKQARTDYTNALTNSSNVAQSNLLGGLDKSQAVQQQYANIGRSANQTYAQTLGLNTDVPIADQIAAQQKTINDLASQRASTPLSAPTAASNNINDYIKQLKQQDINNFIKAHTYAPGTTPNKVFGTEYLNGGFGVNQLAGLNWTPDQLKQMQQNASVTLAQPLLKAAQAKYKADLDAYTKQQAIEKQYSDAQAQLASLQQKSAAQLTPEQQSQNATSKFFNTPEYQLLFGQNATQANPVDRFKFDPGYQFAQDEGMRQIQRNSAAKGLLESGATQRDLLKFAQGNADQNYQRFLQQQDQLYQNYQNQLSGLNQFGAANTGQANILNTYSNLGQLLGGYNFNTGQSLGNADLSTGQNISSLLANQGSLNASAMLNTAAAQSNNILQGSVLGSQIAANQNANNAGNQSSLLAANGYNNLLNGNGAANFTNYSVSGRPLGV